MKRLLTFLTLIIVIAGLVCSQVFATTALYNQTVRVVDSSGNIINSFGSGGAALNGVVTGAANANIFNTTNTAGNTMTNGFTINNASSNQGGWDLIVGDAGFKGAFLLFDDSATSPASSAHYPQGTIQSFSEDATPSDGAGISFSTCGADGNNCSIFQMYSSDDINRPNTIVFTAGAANTGPMDLDMGAGGLIQANGVADNHPFGVRTPPAHLATFGTCNAGAEGTYATQDDSAVACVVGVTAAAGGSTHCAMYCNGSLWKRTGL